MSATIQLLRPRREQIARPTHKKACAPHKSHSVLRHRLVAMLCLKKCVLSASTSDDTYSLIIPNRPARRSATVRFESQNSVDERSGLVRDIRAYNAKSDKYMLRTLRLFSPTKVLKRTTKRERREKRSQHGSVRPTRFDCRREQRISYSTQPGGQAVGDARSNVRAHTNANRRI